MKLFVDRSTVARWESGDRVPDLALVPRIAECLHVDVARLLDVEQMNEPLRILVVDDERVAQLGAVAAIEEVLPQAMCAGFGRPSEALAYVQAHPVAIAFLDIELGRTSGLDLCRELLELSPCVNVVFLTAYREYSFDAWESGACGFLLKPVTPDAIRTQLMRLRYPVAGLLEAEAPKADDNQRAGLS